MMVALESRRGRLYLLSSRRASLNLLTMAREGLLGGLRSATEEVQATQQVATREGVPVTFDGTLLDVTIRVRPALNGAVRGTAGNRSAGKTKVAHPRVSAPDEGGPGAPSAAR